MENSDSIDLLATLKKLVAENKSYESRLQDYAEIIESRNSEIQMLQAMLSEANEHRSLTDEQVKELRELKGNLKEIQRQAGSATYMVSGRQQPVHDSISLEGQFEKLRQDFGYLQSQLTDLQSQLLDVNNKNVLLSLQSNRVAELESLLANLERTDDSSGFTGNPA